MGAWIEDIRRALERIYPGVAPFMGAWIEESLKRFADIGLGCRTLYGCVD